MKVRARKKKSNTGNNIKRGRLAVEEWQLRARYVLRHLDDPIALQRSPLCRLAALERLAKAKYPKSVVARAEHYMTFYRTAYWKSKTNWMAMSEWSN